MADMSMHGIDKVYNQAANEVRINSFADAYARLYESLSIAAKKNGSLNTVEPEIRAGFRTFLQDMKLPLAQKNFEQLLKEKSGEKFLREDGTISWYHELIPIVTMLELVNRVSGRKPATDGYGGIDLKDLEEFGGLDVLISSHLRHDSVEDHTNMKRFKEQLGQMRDEIAQENPRYNLAKADANIGRIVSNVALMTQKKVRRNGHLEKEDVRDYTYRMISSKHANPIVFMLKQADIIHNFATLFGAGKFSAEKRLKRCNEREDMYGPRYGFTDIAIDKWPKFKNAIRILDSMMGFELYPHFRYLESVDRLYKTPHNAPAGINRFVGRAICLDYPDRRFSPPHEGLKRMRNSVDPAQDPEKYARLTSFMKNIMEPALRKHAASFPEVFDKKGGHPGGLSALAP